MKRLFDTGKFTVIVQDNALIHRANITKERVEIWEKQGLILFSLAPYSSEMNRIEDRWLHLKRPELAGGDSCIFALGNRVQNNHKLNLFKTKTNS
jgi:transposase